MTKILIIGPGAGMWADGQRKKNLMGNAKMKIHIVHEGMGLTDPQKIDLGSQSDKQKQQLHAQNNELIKTEINKFKPDIVFAGSRGGRAIQRIWDAGVWRGPTFVINGLVGPNLRNNFTIPSNISVVLTAGGSDDCFTSIRKNQMLATARSGGKNRVLLYYVKNDHHLCESLWEAETLIPLLNKLYEGRNGFATNTTTKIPPSIPFNITTQSFVDGNGTGGKRAYGGSVSSSSSISGKGKGKACGKRKKVEKEEKGEKGKKQKKSLACKKEEEGECIFGICLHDIDDNNQVQVRNALEQHGYTISGYEPNVFFEDQIQETMEEKVDVGENIHRRMRNNNYSAEKLHYYNINCTPTLLTAIPNNHITRDQALTIEERALEAILPKNIQLVPPQHGLHVGWGNQRFYFILLMNGAERYFHENKNGIPRLRCHARTAHGTRCSRPLVTQVNTKRRVRGLCAQHTKKYRNRADRGV